MNKRFKYVLLWAPFVVGGLLFLGQVFNLFSSVLFFVGGYVALKNTFDYRKVRKNNKEIDVVSDVKSSYKKDFSYRSAENIVGLKRTRRHHRVRKRVKY